MNQKAWFVVTPSVIFFQVFFVSVGKADVGNKAPHVISTQKELLDLHAANMESTETIRVYSIKFDNGFGYDEVQSLNRWLTTTKGKEARLALTRWAGLRDPDKDVITSFTDGYQRAVVGKDEYVTSFDFHPGFKFCNIIRFHPLHGGHGTVLSTIAGPSGSSEGQEYKKDSIGAYTWWRNEGGHLVGAIIDVLTVKDSDYPSFVERKLCMHRDDDPAKNTPFQVCSDDWRGGCGPNLDFNLPEWRPK